DVQLALADAIHIDQRAEVLVIRPRRVETPDQTFLNRLIVVHAVRAATFALSANQLFLDQSALLGGRAAAIGRLQLETVIARWVVAGSNHDARIRALFLDVIGNGRRWRIGARQPRDNVVSGQNTRGFDRKPVGQKARVESDDDFRSPVAHALSIDAIGNGLSDQTKI